MIICNLKRVYLETETVGSIYDQNNNLLCKTLELPYRENFHNVSCIPEGMYTVVKEQTSPKHEYEHFRLLDVPDRQGILIHKITYVKDLLGCIGVGSAFADLNKDGVPDITGSTVALAHLYSILPDKFELIISKK